MLSSYVVRSPRALLAGLLLAIGLALCAAPAADAHRLSVGKADRAMERYALGVAEDLASDGVPVTGYDAGNCTRRNAHSFRCIWIVEINDGELVCGGPGVVKFRSRRSRRVRVVVREDPICIDSEGNPVEKRGLG
jgi:hypothetical protein